MLVIILISLIQTAKPSLRSIGGREALPGEYPYVLSMEAAFEIQGQDLYTQICSASALTPTWTLTAAHCIQDLLSIPMYKKTVLRYGTKDKPLRSDVTKTVRHTSFVTELGYTAHDIALIESEVLELASFARLSAVDYSTLVGRAAISAGYGIGSNESNKPVNLFDSARPLQVVEVMISKCDMSYLTPALCSTPKCGNKAYLCPGDSGGPIIDSSGVVAVHTFGFHTQRSKRLPELKGIFKFVGIDTPVSPYIDWIMAQISGV